MARIWVGGVGGLPNKITHFNIFGFLQTINDKLGKHIHNGQGAIKPTTAA